MKTKLNTTNALRGLITGLLLFISMAFHAHAALVVTTTGTPDAGESTWIFSGSYTVATGGLVSAGTTSASVVTGWSGVGDYLGSYPPGSVANGLHYFNELGNVQLTGSVSGVLSIDSIEVYNGGGNLDAWGFASSFDHTYVTGETLTFSGTAVLPVDILSFGGDYLSSPPVSFTVTQNGATLMFNPESVPEPSRALLLLGGLVGVMFRRRRLS
ncbi:PEP-CTERM sorting domain-containing protein [Prosthecobacter sp.]|uniref:PEP-CTERM sorting domain-containing protein n=1 Tax=Prosthecobacter sp. TaxID=1965333 RepID=UPI002AB99C8D|nr:PEP-CTERM sorting domain-containing protein [Prosthecobacter sp.]MDZ4405279.1 PEP-CTERM sorting domain-containing protein [Prosthecobacter sp.]